jgi:hypothetical protein
VQIGERGVLLAGLMVGQRIIHDRVLRDFGMAMSCAMSSKSARSFWRIRKNWRLLPKRRSECGSV